jgi:hypothetical protein
VKLPTRAVVIASYERLNDEKGAFDVNLYSPGLVLAIDRLAETDSGN